MTESSKYVFESQDTVSRDELAELFETLAQRIRSGSVTLAAQQVDVQLPDALKLKLQVEDSVKRSDTRRELELEMGWDVHDDGTPVAQQSPNRGFTIPQESQSISGQRTSLECRHQIHDSAGFGTHIQPSVRAISCRCAGGPSH